MLASLDSELIQPGGSDLAAGVAAAGAAFEAASERPRVLLALADGEDAAARTPPGASDALRAGARVVSVALGSEAGAEVPDGTATLRDRRGRTVVSHRDAGRLAALATATGGACVVGDRWGDVDERAGPPLRRDAALRQGGTVERASPATRVAPLAALAFALLILEWIGQPRRFSAGCDGVARRGCRVRCGTALGAAGLAGTGDRSRARSAAARAPGRRAAARRARRGARGTGTRGRSRARAARRSRRRA
jgi:hypothetical protein